MKNVILVIALMVVANVASAAATSYELVCEISETRSIGKGGSGVITEERSSTEAFPGKLMLTFKTKGEAKLDFPLMVMADSIKYPLVKMQTTILTDFSFPNLDPKFPILTSEATGDDFPIAMLVYSPSNNQNESQIRVRCGVVEQGKKLPKM